MKKLVFVITLLFAMLCVNYIDSQTTTAKPCTSKADCSYDEFCSSVSKRCRKLCTWPSMYDPGRNVCNSASYQNGDCGQYRICQPNTNLLCTNNKCNCSAPLAWRYDMKICDYKIYGEACYNDALSQQACLPNSGLFCNYTREICLCSAGTKWNLTALKCK